METTLQEYINTLCCNYNFKVSSTNWAANGVTNKSTFESRYGFTVGKFTLVGNTIKAEVLNISSNELALDESNITDVEYISIPGLKYLSFFSNKLTTFNPTKPLPKGLLSLGLNGNQIVNFNPTIPLPNTLTDLGLSENKIVTFNPSLSLPTSLTYLGLYSNLMTTAGYAGSEPWATAQPPFLPGCNIDFNFNLNPIEGTNLETILLTKNAIFYM